MITVLVAKCYLCPMYRPDPAGFDHRAECALDTEVVTKVCEIPMACPLRNSPLTVRLREPELDDE